MNSYLILSLWLLISVLSGCCIQLSKKQTLNQNLGTFVPTNAAYEGRHTIQLDDSMIVNRVSLILFSDGSLVTTQLFNFDSVNEKIQNSKRFEIYDGGSPFTWGKYYLKSDTVYIEHVVNISPGGGCKMRPLWYRGLIDKNQLEIFPGPEKVHEQGLTPFIYPKNGILFEYIGSISDTIIDPSKAKFNR
jgi:hypothetical protein